jgi:hypothetical protein
MNELCNTSDKEGRRTGTKLIRSITPRAADKIYQKLITGSKGERLRTAEKIITLARKAWRVVHRLFPDEFDAKISNP